MASCFKEAYHALKPGRWMTVEFSNTQAAVWNTIQSALAEAGFIVANVSALDKKQGSFKAVTTPTAVKQDLVISAYKPNGGFEERFLAEADTEEGVWDFVRTHMKYLPVLKPQGNALLPVPERDPRILYDQMLAYYVRKNRPIPMNSADFQLGLAQRFLERDGMYFLPDQAAQYDRNKLIYTELAELSLFVRDEASAIQWLRRLLKDKPQTFADINPHASWFGLFSTGGTSAAICTQIQQDVAAIGSSPEFTRQLAARGFTPVYSAPAAFAQFISEDAVQKFKLIRMTGAKAE